MREHHEVKARFLHDRIAQLKAEHGALDRRIEQMAAASGFDELAVQRLKKRKLRLKDNIMLLQLQLDPDTPSSQDLPDMPAMPGSPGFPDFPDTSSPDFPDTPPDRRA